MKFKWSMFNHPLPQMVQTGWFLRCLRLTLAFLQFRLSRDVTETRPLIAAGDLAKDFQSFVAFAVV
jgi:hypothetical protein